MDALKDTHLLGRRLVLEFAAEDAVDPEEEIEKMQRKVGKQANKVALQKLAGTGRRKFNVEGDDELDQDDCKEALVTCTLVEHLVPRDEPQIAAPCMSC